MKSYNPKSIERKWQKEWNRLWYPTPKATKRKYYILDMFPYPSGDGLHMGHVENYTATDILARFMRMRGYAIMHPIGWDAFGLPAENFAIKTGAHPDKKTRENIKNFTRQIKSLGMSYDWEREIDTSSPEYYKWTQWMFLFLYKNGLAYKKKAHVNWCPSCKTVLANEQVEDGKCERCKSEVVQKDLEQWFFKITDFVEDTLSKSGRKVAGLLSGLKKIDWPNSTKTAQENWIGRSEGATIKFQIFQPEAGPLLAEKIKTTNKNSKINNDFVEVFTTRLDTIFGCTYVVIAPEHFLLMNNKLQIKNSEEVKKYLEKTKKKTDLERTELAKEKTGVKLDGVEAINPFTDEAVPIFVADYVLGSYGTGAVMAVPAHDERDFEFAKKYKLPIKISIAPLFAEKEGKDAVRPDMPTIRRRTAFAFLKHWSKDKYLCLDWEKFGWCSGIIGGIEDEEKAVVAAAREIIEETGYQHPKFVKFVGEKMHASFFAAHKQVNRYADGVGMLFQLEDDVRDEIEEEEVVNHKAVWVDGDKMEAFLNLKNFQYMWQVLKKGEECFTEDGVLVDSGEFSDLTSQEARKKMTKWLEKKKLGGKKINYRLRDWLVSRQRYWGAPIPIIYCEKCGMVPVPEKDLPVKLPKDVDFRPTGESPLVRSRSFHKVTCPICGSRARRESDTLDTFVCSSWYYLRFADPNNAKKFADPKKLKKYLPVDFYMGGAEHTVLHLLYARFFTKALAKYGFLDFDEPFLKLRHQGMVLAEDGRKMSKSLGNVVNPDDVVKEFGADTLRLYEMFMGPIQDMKIWNTGSIVGLRRFLERVWNLKSKISAKDAAPAVGQGFASEEKNKKLESLTHQTIKKVTNDIEELKFNTAISSLMILVNAMEKEHHLSIIAYQSLLLLLSSFAPHLTEELWHLMGNKKSIFSEKWPKWDPKLLTAETVEIVVQINGKLRGKVFLPTDSLEEDVKKAAFSDSRIAAHITGKKIRKAVYIKDKLLNLVV